jgi:HEPN domain-containing protein
MPRWEEFLREARKFREVAREFDRPGYTNQAVSNAVHAVIAANDAVCLRLINERPGGETHSEAVRVLTRACKGTPWEAEASQRGQQLTQVLQQRNASQYHGALLSAETAERVMKQAERFIEWAEKVLASPDADG